MGLESLLTIIAILVSIGIYYAGLRQGERQERRRREHDRDLEYERQHHERQLEQDRREQELASKVADEFVEMVRRHIDGGPPCDGQAWPRIVRIGQVDPTCYREMRIRSNSDPWGGEGQHVQDLDLVAFFRFIRENRVDFFHTTIEAVAQQVRNAGGVKRDAT